MKPVISFVVPVYNVNNKYLQCCIDSLCHQTFPDIEIVIVDDHSERECALFCDSLAAKDARIKVFHHEVNKGLPNARNTGIENSTANWIAFIDGDDWVELDMAEKLVQEFHNYNADIFVYSGYRNYPDNEICCAHIYENGTVFDSIEKRNSFEEAFLFNQTISHVNRSFAIQSACIRLVSKKLFDKGLRFLDVRFAEDALFHLYSTEMAEKVVYLQYNFYHYRDTPNSMVNSYRENANKEQSSVIERMWEFADKYEKNTSFRKGIYLQAFLAMQMCIWQKYYHNDSPLGIIERRKQCKELFRGSPFTNTLKNIDFKYLRINQKIKYCMMKLGLYRSIVVLRNLNNQVVGQ